MKRSLIILGHLSLIVTAILAIVFYKERVFYLDPGQQLFEMINTGWFKVYVNRHSMMINQTLPLLAIKLGLPLKYIIITYSLSFVVIFYLCFLIAVYGFKNISAGLGIAFAPILIRTAFGHSISEAWLGIAYSAVFYALLNYYHVWKIKGNLYVFLFYLLISTIIAINYFIHPITLFTLAFSVGFTYFNKKEYKSNYIYIVALLVIVPYLYKFLFPGHVHEESFFAGIKMADQLLPKIDHLPVFQYWVHGFRKIYIMAVILVFSVALNYWKKKKKAAYLFSLAFIPFYFIIACLAFYKGDGYFALESRIMPIAFMAIIVFVEAVKDKNKNYFYISGITVMLIFSYYDLCKQMNFFQTPRIKLYEKLLSEVQQYPERKFYIYYTDKQGPPVNSWGSAAETLMLSSLNGKENSRSIIFINSKTKLDEGLKYWPCMFLWVSWYLFYNEELISSKYFNLHCTPYRELPYSTISK